jgi:hypothetical protein
MTLHVDLTGAPKRRSRSVARAVRPFLEGQNAGVPDELIRVPPQAVLHEVAFRISGCYAGKADAVAGAMGRLAMACGTLDPIST